MAPAGLPDSFHTIWLVSTRQSAVVGRVGWVRLKAKAMRSPSQIVCWLRGTKCGNTVRKSSSVDGCPPAAGGGDTTNGMKVRSVSCISSSTSYRTSTS